MGKHVKKDSPDTHAHASSLFSPSSAYRVEYKHVVEAPISDVKENFASLKGSENDKSEGKRKKRKGQQQVTKLLKSSDTGDNPTSNSDSPSSSDEQLHKGVRGSRAEGLDVQQEKKSKKDELLSKVVDDALERTIFVGNLSESTTKKKLKSHFEKYGPIESIRFRSMMLVKDSKVPRRVAAASGTVDTDKGSFHAYIVFEDAQSVSKSLQENMKVLDDRHLRVDRAAVNKMRVKMLGAAKGARAAAEFVSGSHQVNYDVHKSVFIGNMPLDIEDEDLIRFLIAGLGTGSDTLLEAVRIVRDPKTSIGKGIAFALFKTRPARKQALKLNGKVLKGRKLRITEAQSDPASESSTYTRVSSKKASQSWQGATATKSGRVRGINKKVASQPSRSVKLLEKAPKRSGKRPAVAARKLAMKMKKKST
jgi:nucleolar protein 12